MPLRRACYTTFIIAGGLGVSLGMTISDHVWSTKSTIRLLEGQILSWDTKMIGWQTTDLLPVEEIAPGLFRIESSVGSNVLALRGDPHSLLVDAGPEEGVERLQATLDSLGIGSISRVLITHYHDDHLAGASWFKDRGALIVAHSRTAVEAAKDTVIADWNDWHREAANPAAMPDVLFEDDTTVRLDANIVRVRHASRAHTGGDAVVFFENLGVVHTGDIYEVGAYPFIDHWAGGSIAGMIEATDSFLDEYPPETLFVPGHGPPGRRVQIAQYRDMLLDVCQQVLARIKLGDDMTSALQTQPTAAYDDTSWGAARHGRQVAALMFWSLEAGGQHTTCRA